MCRRLLCFGDSNTYGYNPRSYLGGRYPDTVRWTALLNKQGWDVLNQGQNGRTIPQRGWEVDEFFRAPLQEPDISAVMLGSNDLLENPGASAENHAGRMERFLRSALERSPRRKILLIAPPPMKLGAWVSDQKIVEESRRLGLQYKMVAEHLDIAFADAGEWNIDLAYDGVHFSEQGHMGFAQKMEELLSNLTESSL